MVDPGELQILVGHLAEPGEDVLDSEAAGLEVLSRAAGVSRRMDCSGRSVLGRATVLDEPLGRNANRDGSPPAVSSTYSRPRCSPRYRVAILSRSSCAAAGPTSAVPCTSERGRAARDGRSPGWPGRSGRCSGASGSWPRADDNLAVLVDVPDRHGVGAAAGTGGRQNRDVRLFQDVSCVGVGSFASTSGSGCSEGILAHRRGVRIGEKRAPGRNKNAGPIGQAWFERLQPWAHAQAFTSSAPPTIMGARRPERPAGRRLDVHGFSRLSPIRALVQGSARTPREHTRARGRVRRTGRTPSPAPAEALARRASTRSTRTRPRLSTTSGGRERDRRHSRGERQEPLLPASGGRGADGGPLRLRAVRLPGEGASQTRAMR